MDAGNADSQRDLSISNNNIGDVLFKQGNLPEALKSYRAGLAIAERLAGSDAGNADWQRALSISYDRVGDVFVSQGNLADALTSYREGLVIREHLAASDAGNVDWQRDLSISNHKIGGVQVTQGDFDGALKTFDDSLAINDRLAKSVPAMRAGSAIGRLAVPGLRWCTANPATRQRRSTFAARPGNHGALDKTLAGQCRVEERPRLVRGRSKRWSRKVWDYFPARVAWKNPFIGRLTRAYLNFEVKDRDGRRPRACGASLSSKFR